MGSFTRRARKWKKSRKQRKPKKLNGLAHELVDTHCDLLKSSRHCDTIEHDIMVELLRVREKQEQYETLTMELPSAAVVLEPFRPRLEAIGKTKDDAETREVNFARNLRALIQSKSNIFEKTVHLTGPRYMELLQTRADVDAIEFKAEMSEAREKSKEMQALFDGLKEEWDGEKEGLNSDIDDCIRQIKELLQGFSGVEKCPEGK